MKNVFFDMALQQAARLLGHRQRMLMLVGKLAMKLRNVEWTKVKGVDVKEKFGVVYRLFKAYASGKYRNIPWKSLLLITAALIYFVSPIDLIPDVLVGIGFTDDFAILLMVYKAVHSEVEKFLDWEKSQVIES